MSDRSPAFQALLAPLANRGAPAGFAGRLQDRFERAQQARRQRNALLISAATFLPMALLVGVVLAPVLAAPRGLLSAIATTVSALLRRALPFVADGHALLVDVVVLAVVASACCLAIATLVRRESRLAGRLQ